MNESQSLQEKYAANSTCWGCGPANPDGLHIRSFAKNGEVVAEWKPQKKHEAYSGALNGGIIGTLFDCHCNWTAAYHLMKQTKADRLPCTVTAEYAVKFLRPASTNDAVVLSAKVVDSTNDRATVEGTLSANGKFVLRVAAFLLRSGKAIPHIIVGKAQPIFAAQTICN